MQTVAIIPARGGSKGIPGKNIIDFCGAPLLAWSIRQAKAAKSVEAVYVSTDDDAIAAVAQQEGAEVITRPAELATDTATSEAALLHALDHLHAQGIDPSTVVFLQATSPLREASDIDHAIGVMKSDGADSVFSAGRLDDFCIWRQTADGALSSLNYDYTNRGRRQDKEHEREWVENGSIYVFTLALLRSERNRLGGKIMMSEMAFWKSFEVDSADGLELCAHLFRLKGLDK